MLSFRFPFCEANGGRLLGIVSIDISEQVRTQRALSAALASKEVLLKEVHHRVKNNLQVISSLLAMQAESLQEPAVVRALRESQQRVQCMALIHERLHRDDQADSMDFGEHVETLSRDLFHSYGVDSKVVQLRFETEPVWLPLSQAVPSGLIVNELLTNALKYALPSGRAGEIVVALSCGGDGIVRLTVSDNGAGLPAGFDWKQSQSLGLRIVDILTRQLDGTFTLEDNAAQAGAVSSLRFPRAAGETPDESSTAVGAARVSGKRPGRSGTGRLEQTA